MRVYGVDLGTRRIAIACPELELVWSTTTEGSRDMRRFPTEIDAGRELGQRALALFESWELASGDDTFIAERPFVGRPHGNVRTAIGQALSAGAALVGMPGRVVLIDQALWKKELCDNGHASKDDVQAFIERCHPALAQACRGDENRFDAVGIALGCAVLAQAGDL